MTGAPSDSYGAGLFRTASAGNMARAAAARRRQSKAPPKRKARPRKPAAVKLKHIPKRKLFAALLAADLPIAVICERMGITQKAGERHLYLIRKDLGPQAV